MRKRRWWKFILKLLKRSESMQKIIVIDAGHGGKDSGAVNKSYIVREKEINLAVATYLEAELKLNYPNITTFMSRDTDVFISLKNRCIKANYIMQEDASKPAIKADLFLSIHTNAREVKGKYGLEIETYYCRGSEKGKKFAEAIQEALVSDQNTIPTIDRGVKVGERWSKKRERYMPFYVLKHTKMPAVLVELGFLSDIEECIYLSNVRNQRLMAQVLSNALSEFIIKEA